MLLHIVEWLVLATEYGIPLGLIYLGNSTNEYSTHSSMPLVEFGYWLLLVHVFGHIYIQYLENLYFTKPDIRTQKTNVKQERTTKSFWAQFAGTGDETLGYKKCFYEFVTHVELLVSHGLVYKFWPGFFPAARQAPYDMEWLLANSVNFVGQLYVISFGMYWMHRWMHEVDFLWTQVHSFHHLWKAPIARITYLDHPFEAWCLSMTGPAYLAAMYLFPLDRFWFYVLTVFRIMESLEKHSGHIGWYNIAYSLQQWLPAAAQPYHHDWHHEVIRGNSNAVGSNYTFTAAGGVWDVLFGTRKEGLRSPHRTTKAAKAG